jgi:hypothetical protein
LLLRLFLVQVHQKEVVKLDATNVNEVRNVNLANEELVNEVRSVNLANEVEKTLLVETLLVETLLLKLTRKNFEINLLFLCNK